MISERNQDQKGTYVFVRIWSLDFYMHTHTRRHAHMHTHMHAQIHPHKQKDTHSLVWEGRLANRVTREGNEQI